MYVIKRETDTFVAQDFEGWARCWVQDGRTQNICISPTFGATVLEGWPHIQEYFKTVFEGGTVCEISEFQRLNCKVTISGDLAHVTYDGHSQHAQGRIERTSESRTLEKSEGCWRILHASFVLRGHQPTDTYRVSVDAKGKVIDAPKDARAALKDHPALVLSNGYLRAKTLEWDKRLQGGLQCAAQQHGYFQHYRYARQHGQGFHLPVVLGEAPEGGVCVCVLFVRDGVTFVETQASLDFEARLEVAKAIFSLSDGQVGLAHKIVAGDSLTRAAQHLGISVNTARTHLARIYVKTGVNSQTALVRTLLSVGS